MLRVKDITYRVGDRTLFEGASAHVPEGKRVGLVGANGSGKTTLLRLVTGELELDGGAVDIRSGCSVGTVQQETLRGSVTPLETVLAADKERQNLLAEADSATCPDRIAVVHTRLADIDAHSAPARAAVILSGLGFNEEMQRSPVDSLSGGWKVRVALAAALFSQPDLLLLDEPTNHLDLESVLWLVSYLKSYPNTLVVVSHDRNLLNQVTQNTLFVKDGKLTLYTGGYDAFAKARAARAALDDAARVKQEVKRKHLQSFVDRFKAKASKAKQAQSRVKMLERLNPPEPVTSDRKVVFDFPGPKVKPSPLVKLDGAAVGYDPQRPVLSDVHLSVFNEDRVALLGANGNGKTTLVRLIAGELAALEGGVVSASKLQVGYFAQDHLERLDVDVTALDQMRRLMPDDPQDKVRGWLGRFGFEQSRAEVLVGHLSGGEKTRLALAILALTRPNLMILDEPTNHLDVDAREALIHGLNEFDGAVLLISHDRHLIEATVDQLWLVEGGTCKQYFGDLEDYFKQLMGARALVRREKREESAADGTKVSRKDARRLAAEARERVAPLKKEIKEAEEALEKLSAEAGQIDEELMDPSVYEGDPDRVASLVKRKRELEDLVQSAEELWMDAQARLEELEEEGDD